MAIRNLFFITICIIGLFLPGSNAAELHRTKGSLRNNKSQKERRDGSRISNQRPRKLQASSVDIMGQSVSVAGIIGLASPLIRIVSFPLNVIGSIGDAVSTVVGGARSAADTVKPILVSLTNRQYGAAGEGVENITNGINQFVSDTFENITTDVVEGIEEQVANTTATIRSNKYTVNGDEIDGASFLDAMGTITSNTVSAVSFGADTLGSTVSGMVDVNVFVISNLANGTLNEETSTLAQEQVNFLNNKIKEFNGTLDYEDKIIVNNKEYTVGAAIAKFVSMKDSIENVLSTVSQPGVAVMNQLQKVRDVVDQSFNVNIDQNEEIELNGKIFTLGDLFNPVKFFLGNGGDDRQ